MSKTIDLNGFWLIEDNPISRVGVFPYLGKQISPELEPDKIYMVYRPAEELTSPETIESFNAVPFIDEHEMIGEGFTKYDDRPAGGVLFNVKANGDVLTGDFKIYSEELQEEIKNGKKELSLGYLCDYRLEKGVYNGQRYDAVQQNIRGNHVALVNHGRMGSDVRVYDKAITMDSLDITKEISASAGSPKESRAEGSPTKTTNQQGESNMKYVSLEEVKAILKKGLQWGDEENPTEKLIAELLDEKAVEGFVPTGDEDPDETDKRKAIREIMAIASKPDSDFDGGEKEKIETIAKILEKSEYSKSESGTANDEEPDEEKKKSEDKCGKDEDPKDDDDKKKASEDEDDSDKDDKKKDSEDEDDDKDDGKKKAEDSMPKAVLKMIAKRNALVKEVEPLIGTFACDEMTVKDAAVYACKKLNLQATEDEAELVLRGFLAANAKNNKVYGLDSAVSVQNNGLDKGTQKYLKGE